MPAVDLLEGAAALALVESAAPDPDPPTDGDDAPLPEDPQTAGYTDTDNAAEFARAHAGRVRWCPSWNTWLLWDGRRWCRDHRGDVHALAKETVVAIAERVAADPDVEKKSRANLISYTKSRRGREAMVTLARCEPGIAVLSCQLDADPWAFNVLNGTLNLRTGELRAHCRTDLVTKLAPVAYDADARSELLERVLAHACGDDAELVAFVQRAAGYTLTGDTREEKLFFVHGPTRASKSTLVEAFKSTMGEYAKTSDFETFLARPANGGARNDIARLEGARLVASIEVDDGKKLAEGLVKQLTGGDTIAARFLYTESFEFRPTFKLWLVANHTPKVRDDDGAMWARILRIPFDHTVPKDKRDPKVKAALMDPGVSGAAILAWMVRGCLEWQRVGLGVPASVEKATEDYRASMDPLGDFFAERCEFGAELSVAKRVVRERYETWARETGVKHPLTPRKLAERLRGRLASEYGENWKPETSVRFEGKPVDAWKGIGVQVDDGRPEPSGVATGCSAVGGSSARLGKVAPRARAGEGGFTNSGTTAPYSTTGDPLSPSAGWCPSHGGKERPCCPAFQPHAPTEAGGGG